MVGKKIHKVVCKKKQINRDVWNKINPKGCMVKSQKQKQKQIHSDVW